jgi:pimeloyl-ACP methyl ester carboxylesterase
LYGFFSSRRALTVLEKLLVARGHQVLSFNLGGLLGTFFTKSVLDTAAFIDYKIKRQIDRHGFKKFHVVAHSKGGLVALWWILKLGGHIHCDKVITMGTPFAGTRWTYLALVTPLGFFWRDMWQMRPGSSFLRYLKAAEIPENVSIHCLHSTRDNIARGEKGLFKPRKFAERVESIPMNKVSHFEFLYRRDVADRLSAILGNGTPVTPRGETGPEIAPIGPIAPVDPAEAQLLSSLPTAIDPSHPDLPFSSIENIIEDDEVEVVSDAAMTVEENQEKIASNGEDDDDRSAS